MPFFRIALVCCAIFSLESAVAAPGFKFKRPWSAKAKAKRQESEPCTADLTKSSADMPYLDLLRKHRRNEGDVMVDLTETAEWRTTQFTNMTYEIFGGPGFADLQLRHVAQAAVTYLRQRGDLARARMSRTARGNLILDLPIGAASAAFLLMIEKRLTSSVPDVHDIDPSERAAIHAWITRSGVDLESRLTIPRDAAE